VGNISVKWTVELNDLSGLFQPQIILRFCDSMRVHSMDTILQTRKKKSKEKQYPSSKMQPVGNKICWLKIPKGSACSEVLLRESNAVRCCLYLSPLQH